MKTGLLEPQSGIQMLEPSELTIASGVIVPTQMLQSVDTEADAGTDTITDITTTTYGGLIYLKAENAARIVTVTDTGNINTGGLDIVLSVNSYTIFMYEPTSDTYRIAGGAGISGSGGFLADVTLNFTTADSEATIKAAELAVPRNSGVVTLNFATGAYPWTSTWLIEDYAYNTVVQVVGVAGTVFNLTANTMFFFKRSGRCILSDVEITVTGTTGSIVLIQSGMGKLDINGCKMTGGGIGASNNCILLGEFTKQATIANNDLNNTFNAIHGVDSVVAAIRGNSSTGTAPTHAYRSNAAVFIVGTDSLGGLQTKIDGGQILF